MRLNEIIQERQRFGTIKTLQDLALRGLNHFVSARVLKGVKLETVRREFLECDKPYRGGFLTEAEIMNIIRNSPEYEMTESFVHEAFAKGDECYGFMDGSVLAGYGWYASSPTAIDAPGMLLHFDSRYIYMYKGFTNVAYRGQRLHAIAMTRALEAYQAEGYRGLVSYVEWNNFSSLKSCYRIGYTDFGNIFLARLFGRHMTYADKGCENYSFCLKLDVEGGSSDRAVRAAGPGVPTDARH